MHLIAMTAAMLLVLTTAPLPLRADDHGDEMKFQLHPLDKIEWKEGPASLPKGAKIAVLEGDPTKPGPFVFRVKAPDGYRIPLHTHPKTERITVIQGTFHIGMGDQVDDSQARPMPVGTYGYWAAGMKHFVFVKGETIVQFHGEGPLGDQLCQSQRRSSKSIQVIRNRALKIAQTCLPKAASMARKTL